MNKEYINCGEIPLGLSMALSKNVPAMEMFSEMSDADRSKFIEGCKKARSKSEMQNYVNSLVSQI